MPSSFPVLSLIQGISEQSSFSRPQSSAEEQKNCINDLLRGSRARGGTRVINHWDWNIEDAFYHRIERSREEDYLVILKGTDLKIINLASGVEAAITYLVSAAEIDSYLTHTGKSRKAFAAGTVNDTTFLASRQKVIQMDPSLSPAKTAQGIAHFRSSNYSTEYKLKVIVGGTTYQAAYKTPDNSEAGNADYIATNRLAQEFATAMATALGSGWSVARRGSSILITNLSGTHFKLATEDGLGGQQFIAFTDRVKKVADLPVSAWDSFTVAVGSARTSGETDYYLRYTGGEQDGVWAEVVAPSTEVYLDPATMPLHLINTGLNAFTVGHAPWGARVAGDGVNSSKNPSFVGQTIRDIQFIDSRLAIITEGAFSLSRSRNGYVFFPDTAQTTLDTDPIDYTVANGKVTNITRSVVVAKKLQLWANRSQSIVTGGTEALKEDTAENPPVMSYEYDGEVPPIPVGQSSLVFTTENGNENQVMEVVFRDDTPIGEIPINAHCPSLVSGTIRQLEAAGTAQMLFALNEEDRTKCYVYQWHNNGSERVQSAWNYWTFPGSGGLEWVGATGSTIKALIKHGNRVALEVLELKPNTDEPGLVPLRADHRLSEAELPTIFSGADISVELPWPLTDDQKASLVCYCRVDDDTTGEQRGQIYPVTWGDDQTFSIPTTNADLRFWVGHIATAEREAGRLYISSDRGTEMLDAIHIEAVRVKHKDSVTYDIICIPRGVDEEEETVETYSSRHIGDPAAVNNRLVVSKEGQSEEARIGYAAGDCRIILRNSTIYPSSWEAMEYIYRAEKRHA